MGKYNFLNLSPAEFEELTRDLLQKKLGCFIESFKDGKDGGIDLRFAEVDGKSKIVQCKRYKDFNSLKGTFKKESAKVKKLNPEKYYFVTSAGLSSQNKQDIFETFKPFIKSTEDILGADELNNLLVIHKEIEIAHYKLWLSSVAVMQKVLHSKIHNQTESEFEEIKDNIKFYVQNDSFYEALKIIEENNFVIISGIPGIGKTTLARILVYHFLGKGFDEFIFMSDSIDVGDTAFNKDSKQVFLFDDFLGSNFLETQKLKNEDSKIIKFINRIKKSKNKILIFTTREYILNQAKSEYETFERSNLDSSKCIVDLSKYTKLVRAKILYNHLFFNEIPEKFINEIIRNQFYLKIINHKNYNPRIIETIVKNEVWNRVSLIDFQNVIIGFFDNPKDVWKVAYEKNISELSKVILRIIFSMGTPIIYEDLYKVVENFTSLFRDKYDVKFNQDSYDKSLSELENVFIKTNKAKNVFIETDKANKDITFIEYHNPSIYDFLNWYLKDKRIILEELVESAIYYNQYINLFLIISTINDLSLIKVLISKLCENFSHDSFSYIVKKSDSSKNYIGNVVKNDFDKFMLLQNSFSILRSEEMRGFVVKKLNEFITEDTIDSALSYICLIESYKDEINMEASSLIKRVANKIETYDDLMYFEELREIYPEDFGVFIMSKTFNEISIPKIIKHEFSNVNKSNLDIIKENLKYIEKTYGTDIFNELSEIEDIEREQEERGQNDEKNSDEQYQNKINKMPNLFDNSIKDKSEIIEMFNSLKND